MSRAELLFIVNSSGMNSRRYGRQLLPNLPQKYGYNDESQYFSLRGFHDHPGRYPGRITPVWSRPGHGRF